LVAVEGDPVNVLSPVMVFVESVMVGVPGAITVKSVALVAVSAPTSTVILPVVAPLGTKTVICVPAPFTTGDAAAMPLNLTPGVAPKLLPLIVTVSPEEPDEGEKEVIAGAVGLPADAINLKLSKRLLPEDDVAPVKVTLT
jgi:hypothetical protein